MHAAVTGGPAPPPGQGARPAGGARRGAGWRQAAPVAEPAVCVPWQLLATLLANAVSSLPRLVCACASAATLLCQASRRALGV